jgi:inorganic pyrophosphatase
VFAGLLVGAMLPFWFSAMTMKSVGKAALAMVEEVSWLEVTYVWHGW